MQIALERKAQRASDFCQLVQAYVAQFRVAKSLMTDQLRIEVAPAVTAAPRWRGRRKAGMLSCRDSWTFQCRAPGEPSVRRRNFGARQTMCPQGARYSVAKIGSSAKLSPDLNNAPAGNVYEDQPHRNKRV